MTHAYAQQPTATSSGVFELADDSDQGTKLSPPEDRVSENAPQLYQSVTAKIYDTQYGKRTIGFIGGLCLMVNNCLGPGLVQMNTQMQISGWLPTIFATALFGLFAFMSSWMLLYAQSRVPLALGRVEFTGICEHYFSRPLFYFAILFYILTMIVQCISGIQQTMQLMDLMIVRLFGKSCALEIWPNFFSTPCSNIDTGFSVFEPGSGVISLGFVASGLLAIPFGFFPLEDSIIFQIISCAIMGICVVLLGIDLNSVGYVAGRLPAVGESMSGLVGLMMFNFSLAFSLPSWNNERLHSVRVKRSLGTAIGIGSITMIVIGILGGMAFPMILGSSKNLIDFASDSNRPLTIASVYIFSLANNVTTVPVFSIMIRYTLMEHKIIRKPWIGNILAIAVPWMLIVPFSTGSGFQNIIEFGGSVFIGITCFVAPPVLFLCALRPKWLFRSAEESAQEADIEEHAGVPKDPDAQDDNDTQFPNIVNEKSVNILGGGTFVILGLLLASLIYAWITSA